MCKWVKTQVKVNVFAQSKYNLANLLDILCQIFLNAYNGLLLIKMLIAMAEQGF